MTDNSVTIGYYGGAAFKITTASGKKILVDPYITQNKLCRTKLDYFYDADLILVSHAAFDHLGDTVEIMKQSQAALICGGDVARHVQQEGIPKERVRSIIYGDLKEFQGIRVKAVDARHISKITSGTETIYGVPMGFVITTDNDIRIYHAGDTSLIGDLKLVGMFHRPHILLVGISGVAEGFPIEMEPREAAFAALWVAPDVVIPTHYPPGSPEPAKFREAVKMIAPNVEPVMLEPNKQLVYTKYQVKVE